MRKLMVISGLASMLAVLFSGLASAHVVVAPGEVLTASFQTYNVGVPNEKDIPVSQLKLLIPKGLTYVTPTVKPGWEIAVEKSGNEATATVTAITWSGGTIPAGQRDDFTFSAKAPNSAGELQWKAYQTYADGSTVAWDKAATAESHDSEDANSGPFSVTKVVSEAPDQASASSDTSQVAANRALYIAIAGLGVALVALAFATRKPTK